MEEKITEITLLNEDGESLRVRIDRYNEGIIVIEITDNTFWFKKDEWKKLVESLELICMQ